MVPPLSTCTWRVSPRSVVPTSRAPTVGGFIGGIFGAVGGAIPGALAAASLGPLGGFLATLGGAVAGGVGGALIGRWLATPKVPS
jgi:hypothetical protein